ncbi:hypothetical protein HZA99_06540 [Candidatus Woesearchaeota archaeon]|nr:hypothetical protein [Candidatus Woesearchaeota archaeon]
MDVFDRLRKKLRKEAENTFEIDERSDFPIHERYVREEDILTMKEKKQEKQKRVKR